MTESIGSGATIPVSPKITNADLARQFWLDAYGKEVQSAATYSYMWMADQAGHMGIGILLHFAITPIFAHLPQVIGLGDFFANPPFRSELAGFIITALIVSYWEWSAYSTDVKAAADSQFTLQDKLLRDNAIIAATYMAMGGAIGWALHLDWQVSVPLIALIGVIAVMLARPWLRQKIIWQKASLPFLSRLTNLKKNMDLESVKALEKMINAALPPVGPPQALVMAGMVGSGRTATAVSIGTEFAFKGASVRYTSISDLIELAQKGDLELKDPPPGPSNIGYWSWSQAQVLIIDDIGPLVAYSRHVVADDGPTLGLKNVLEDSLGNVRSILASRHTVWVLGPSSTGELAAVEQAAEIVGTFLGHSKPLAIMLTPAEAPPIRQKVRVPGSPIVIQPKVTA